MGPQTPEGVAHLDTAWERYAKGGGPGDAGLVAMLIQVRAISHGGKRGPDAGLAMLAESGEVLRARLVDPTDAPMVDERLAETRSELEALRAKIDGYRAKADAPGATLQDIVSWGSVQEQLGQTEGAEATYTVATERFPESFDAWYTLGAFHFNQAAALQQAGAKTRELEPAMQAAKGPLEKAGALKSDPAALQALGTACSVLMDLECLKATDAALEATR